MVLVALSSLLDTYLDPFEPEVQEALAGTEGDTASADAPAHGTSTTGASNKKAKKAVVADSSTGGIALGLVAAVSPSGKSNKPRGIFGVDTRALVVFNALGMLLFFVLHCTYVTSSAYSSPSVVLASQNPDGSQHIIDDFREAYYWLRQNTPQDAVVMSWWDYGYQIAGMADRPTLVDNNTWNNSESHSFRTAT